MEIKLLIIGFFYGYISGMSFIVLNDTLNEGQRSGGIALFCSIFWLPILVAFLFVVFARFVFKVLKRCANKIFSAD